MVADASEVTFGKVRSLLNLFFLRHPSVPPSALVLPTWSSHTFKSTTKPEGPEPAPDYYEIYPSGSGPALCLEMSGKTRSRGVIGLPQPQLQQILSESLAG